MFRCFRPWNASSFFRVYHVGHRIHSANGKAVLFESIIPEILRGFAESSLHIPDPSTVWLTWHTWFTHQTPTTTYYKSRFPRSTIGTTDYTANHLTLAWKLLSCKVVWTAINIHDECDLVKRDLHVFLVVGRLVLFYQNLNMYYEYERGVQQRGFFKGFLPLRYVNSDLLTLTFLSIFHT